jgi:hypothetical protein
MKYTRTMIAIIGSTAAIKLNEYLIISKGFSTLTALLISAAVAAIIMFLIEICVTDLIANVSFIRKWLDPLGKFEGVWLINLPETSERPYSVGRIEYNRDLNLYSFAGTGFDKEGIAKSAWESTEVAFNLKKNQLIYRANAMLGTEVLENLGWITFQKELFGSNYTRGQGIFIDIGREIKIYQYTLERLSRKELGKKYGIKVLRNNEELRELIKLHYEKKEAQR